ncbi:hypothetical protein Q7P36_011191 [Cladosporium allicinum]|jgi:hypothetical protein
MENCVGLVKLHNPVHETQYGSVLQDRPVMRGEYCDIIVTDARDGFPGDCKKYSIEVQDQKNGYVGNDEKKSSGSCSGNGGGESRPKG